MSCRYWAILKIQSLLLKSGDGHLTIFLDFVYASLDSLWWEDHPLISMKTSSFSCPNSRFGDEEIGFTTGAGKYAGGADMSVESNPNGPTASRNDDLLRIPAFAQVSPIRWAAAVLLPCLGLSQTQRSFSAGQHSACSKTIQNLPGNELK